MIIWLASYPRSGNTLTRILMWRHFGLKSLSLYGDGESADIGAHLAPVVGFEPHGPLGQQSLAAMAAAPETFVVKTHEPPPPGCDWPAIYVVRDGRSAISSYWHYRNRPGQPGPSLEEVVAGLVQFGSWSEHVAAWLDAPAVRRLVLRYEDLARPSWATLKAIGDFLGRHPADAPRPDFAALQALAPDFFRVGDDARNAAELEARCPALFNALHGAVQARLGYPVARLQGEPALALAAEIRAMLAQRRQGTASGLATLLASVPLQAARLRGPWRRALYAVRGLWRGRGRPPVQ